ncbi:MAG TPA: alpha/beta hydrolase [Thermoplasmata archaeon]|nr:alpha/beta hydrolase [Thermoplasmata archaeon]
MPFAHRNDAEIYYEERGRGPPLLLLEGLGYATWMWRGQSPALEDRFRLFLVDNRGVGRSSPLSAPYTIPDFAHDAIAALDAAGIDQAAVLGASMGGMIAQSVAALVPRRVTGLVLACTTPGGPYAKSMSPETLAEFGRSVPGETTAERLRRVMALALTPSFPLERSGEFDAIIADRLNSLQPPEQWAFQALSGREFDARDTDARLTVPALVATGTEDRVVPWTNSLALYKLIPGASLLLFRGQNHLAILERATEFNGRVARFLGSATGEAFPAGVEEVG